MIGGAETCWHYNFKIKKFTFTSWCWARPWQFNDFLNVSRDLFIFYLVVLVGSTRGSTWWPLGHQILVNIIQLSLCVSFQLFSLPFRCPHIYFILFFILFSSHMYWQVPKEADEFFAEIHYYNNLSGTKTPNLGLYGHELEE